MPNIVRSVTELYPGNWYPVTGYHKKEALKRAPVVPTSTPPAAGYRISRAAGKIYCKIFRMVFYLLRYMFSLCFSAFFTTYYLLLHYWHIWPKKASSAALLHDHQRWPKPTSL